jgi:hypothetical protein
MTVLSRIDFGRHMVAWLAGHKLKQGLHPKLWMLWPGLVYLPSQ